MIKVVHIANKSLQIEAFVFYSLGLLDPQWGG